MYICMYESILFLTFQYIVYFLLLLLLIVILLSFGALTKKCTHLRESDSEANCQLHIYNLV